MTWKDQAIKALIESIKHWERMAAGGQDDEPAADQCACCDVWFGKEDCWPCPIALRTERKLCYETPYYRAYDAWDSGDRELFEQGAADMVDYLKETLALVRSGDLTDD